MDNKTFKLYKDYMKMRKQYLQYLYIFEKRLNDRFVACVF